MHACTDTYMYAHTHTHTHTHQQTNKQTNKQKREEEKRINEENEKIRRRKLSGCMHKLFDPSVCVPEHKILKRLEISP